MRFHCSHVPSLAVSFALMGAVILTPLVSGTSARAQTLTFEGFAAPGDLRNVNPQEPHTEAGFRLTPTNSDSAVFSSTATTKFIGRQSDFFGFAENNITTLTQNGGATFTFTSVILGPSTLASALPVGITVVGNVSGGGTLSSSSLFSTATLATFNWSNLTSVVFRTTNDAGIDNISLNASAVNPVPEPSEWLAMGMAGASVGGLMIRARRRKSSASS